MAFWSGPARQAFAELMRVLEKVDLSGRLELVVVDTDGCPDLYELPEFIHELTGHTALISGAGETAWIRNGRIVLTSGYGYHPECFEPNTLQLLKDCVAESFAAADGGPFIGFPRYSAQQAAAAELWRSGATRGCR
jgi:hypothetical protein